MKGFLVMMGINICALYWHIQIYMFSSGALLNLKTHSEAWWFIIAIFICSIIGAFPNILIFILGKYKRDEPSIVWGGVFTLIVMFVYDVMYGLVLLT